MQGSSHEKRGRRRMTANFLWAAACYGLCVDGLVLVTDLCYPPCPPNMTSSGMPRYQCVVPGVCVCSPGLSSINCSTMAEQLKVFCCNPIDYGEVAASLLRVLVLPVFMCLCLLALSVKVCAVLIRRVPPNQPTS